MLITKTVKVRWNAKNKERFISLGYKFTKMKDEFIVNTEDLSHGSVALVDVVCDYCGKTYTTKFSLYYKGRKICKKDCCKDKECTSKKAREAIFIKYGVDNVRLIPEINEKISRTNIEKYGCENPFGNKEIQEKIAKTNIERYGYKQASKNRDIANKIGESGRRYFKNHPEAIKIKENSPHWKGGVEYSNVERATFEYRNWRKLVFAKDVYTCQKCGSRNGNGKKIILNAHHILNWRDNEDYRYNVDNGITLCSECHVLFHSIYGKRNNTLQQLNEFLGYEYEIDINKD